MANIGGAAPSDGASAAGMPTSSAPYAENKTEPKPTVHQEPKPSEYQGFSAATLMLINRVRGQAVPTALNASSAPGSAAPSGYEEARRRVLEGMRTLDNMTLPPLPSSAKRNTGVKFPGPIKSRGGTPTTGQARSTTVVMTGAHVLTPSRTAARTSTNTPNVAPRTKIAGQSSSAKKGQKRKRFVEEDSETGDESEDMSDLGGDSESEGSDAVTTFPAMTQSGRRVVKPAHFNATALELPPRKKSATQRSLGKSAEQALCKRCGRGHSPATNMIVFCDGCNTPYHQMCHNPVVSDEVVENESKPWYCADCEAKETTGNGLPEAPPAAIDPALEVHNSSDWEEKSLDERRAFLLSMPRAHLVSLLLKATAMHPDIPILPAATSGPQAQNDVQAEAPSGPQLQLQPQDQSETQSYQQSQPQSLSQPRPQSQPPQEPPHNQQSVQQLQPRRTTIYPQQPFPPSATFAAGLFSRAEANPTAPMNFIRKIQATNSSAPPSPSANSLIHNESSTIAPPNLSPASSPTRPIHQASSAPPTVPQTQQQAIITTIKFEQPLQLQNPGDDDHSRESTPASPPYPRPGNGLMAKLRPDHEDLEWLVGGGDDSAVFSHTVFDKEGRAEKRVENGIPVPGVRH